MKMNIWLSHGTDMSSKCHFGDQETAEAATWDEGPPGFLQKTGDTSGLG